MRILITGASGKLGGYLVREALARGHEVEAWSGSWRGELFGAAVQPVDLTSPESLEGGALQRSSAEAIIHAAAHSEVKDCFEHPETAERVNRDATGVLARWSAQKGRRFLFVSTDMVFDGEQAPYAESAAPSPTSVYGRSKVAGEQEVLACAEHLVARVALMAGPTLTLRRSFFDFLVSQLQSPEPKPVRLFVDEWRAVLSLRVAARTLLDLIATPARGVYHIAGSERLSRFDFGLRTAAALGIADPLLERGFRSEFTGPEPRQKDLCLTCDKLLEALPGWQAGNLEDEIREMMVGGGRCLQGLS